MPIGIQVRAVSWAADQRPLWRRHDFFCILTATLLISVLVPPFHSARFTICLYHLLLGIPGPGCGMFRAFLFIGHGDLLAAIRLNPNSVLAFSLVLFGWLNGLAAILWGREAVVSLTEGSRRAVYGIAGFLTIVAWAVNFMSGTHG